MKKIILLLFMCMILLAGSVSAFSNVSDDSGITFGSGTVTWYAGGQMITNKNITILEVGLDSISTVTKCTLYNSSDGSSNEIENVSVSGLIATFTPFNVYAGYYFTIKCGDNYDAYTLAYKDGASFNPGTNINYTGGCRDGGCPTTAFDNIRNITTIEFTSGPFAPPSSLIITLNEPSNTSKKSDPAVRFNVSVIPTLLNLTNASITVWNSSNDIFNSTLNVLSGNETYITSWNITNFSLGQTYHWNVYGCGTNATGTMCNWSISNYTFVSSAFSEINTTYNESVLETTRQTFIININANPSVSAASAGFWYNGTKYSSTVTDGTAGIYKAVNALDISLAEVDGNKTFFWEWEFTLTDSTSVKQNSTTFSHEVNRTWLTLCNTTYTTPFINFTTKNAENPFPLLNATLKTAWEWWLGNGDITRNYSYEDVTEAKYSFGFCMSPNQTYTTNLQAEFDGTGYSQNYHYLVEAPLDNETNNVSLYLLNDSKATLTVLTVYDQAQSPIENVYIQIQLYDVGTDTFYTIGMAKTAFNGEDIAYLNWYDTLYKFILTSNGTVVETTTPYKISETPQIFEISTVTTFVYDKFEDFVYNLYFNNATNNFVLTFVKPSGLVDKGCLRVIKRNPSNDTSICGVCETSSSATLYCNIGSYGNGTFIATFYATGSLKVIDTIYTLIGTVNEIYDLIGNTDGSAYAFLFAGIILSLFFVHPILGIIGVMLGMLGAMILGFQPINYMEFMGIVVLGGIVIWILKR